MKLEEAITLYVQRKHAAGMSFTKGYKTYQALLRTVGNLPLSQINVNHVLQFLEHSHTSTGAFRRAHSLLRYFFEYCVAHGAIAGVPMPANLPARRSDFLAHIYT